jgi:hypothetical protein
MRQATTLGKCMRGHSSTIAAAVILMLLACSAAPAVPQRADLPRPDKIVVLVEENKAYGQVIGSPHAPYINELVRRGALFTRAYAITHPSQPNYVALFSGSPAGVHADWCASGVIRRKNLGSLLVDKYGASGFVTYSEHLPSAGFAGCTAPGGYARKHNPMVNWQGTGFEGALSAAANQPLDALPKDFSALPKVAFVVPSTVNDMHDGDPQQAIANGDSWLRDHIDTYVDWAMRNNSLLILLWDEDDFRGDNRVPLVFVGPMVKAGSVVDDRVDHYDVLRTLLDLHRVEAIGEARNRKPITSIWTDSDASLK